MRILIWWRLVLCRLIGHRWLYYEDQRGCMRCDRIESIYPPEKF